MILCSCASWVNPRRPITLTFHVKIKGHLPSVGPTSPFTVYTPPPPFSCVFSCLRSENNGNYLKSSVNISFHRRRTARLCWPLSSSVCWPLSSTEQSGNGLLLSSALSLFPPPSLHARGKPLIREIYLRCRFLSSCSISAGKGELFLEIEMVVDFC